MLHTPRFWRTRGLLAIMLLPLSQLYWWVAQLRLRRYQPHRLSVPVICVGNLVAGGAGKTPLVAAIAALLTDAQHIPAILSRGYGGTVQHATRVDPAVHRAAEVGDEPLILAQHAPVFVSPRRRQGALAAIAEGAQTILMDDGLQNPTLHKTLSILTVDGAYGFGNRWMLPAGPLREPIAHGLAKIDATVIYGEDAQQIRDYLPNGKPVFVATLAPKGDVAWLRGASLVAFAGIAHPNKFFDLLESLGATLASTSVFPDHHPFSDTQLAELQETAARQQSTLITTRKDWVRLPVALQASVKVLEVTCQFEDSDAFRQWLLDALAQRA